LIFNGIKAMKSKKIAACGSSYAGVFDIHWLSIKKAESRPLQCKVSDIYRI